MKINRQAVKDYAGWHWGSKATHVIEWSDPDVGDAHLIEIGRLAELYVRGPNDGAKIKGTQFSVPESLIPHNYLSFDKGHRFQRIYVLADTALCRALKRAYWNPGGTTYLLADVAKAAGGRHATADYPSIDVQPVGILTHVTYLTEKTGDTGEARLGWKDANLYIHHMGEESGIQPVLCIDSRGRIWLAGGNYTCPTPGITD